ncbi:hypothetical protein [Methylocaldum sp. MU1018]
MRPWKPTTASEPVSKERIGLVIIIGLFCALILISRFQSLIDFPYMASAADFVAQEKDEPAPYKDRMPSAERQSPADDDEGHDRDRYLLSSYHYRLSHFQVEIPASAETVATNWISEPTVPPPRRR